MLKNNSQSDKNGGDPQNRQGPMHYQLTSYFLQVNLIGQITYQKYRLVHPIRLRLNFHSIIACLLYFMRKIIMFKKNFKILSKYINEKQVYQRIYSPQNSGYPNSDKVCKYYKTDNRSSQLVIYLQDLGKQNLDDYRKKDFKTKRQLIRQLFQGLQFLQRCEVFHGDIKYDNISVVKGCIKIFDFDRGGIKDHIKNYSGNSQYKSFQGQISVQKRSDQCSALLLAANFMYNYDPIQLKQLKKKKNAEGKNKVVFQSWQFQKLIRDFLIQVQSERRPYSQIYNHQFFFTQEQTDRLQPINRAMKESGIYRTYEQLGFLSIWFSKYQPINKETLLKMQVQQLEWAVEKIRQPFSQLQEKQAGLSP